MNYGIQNEYDFVELFNNKYLNELNRNSNNAKERYLVCARWNYIKEDIVTFKSSKF